MIPEDKETMLAMGKSQLDYLREKKDQFLMAIPICTVLVGFVAYGCWQLQADRKTALMALSVPALMLAIYMWAFISTRRKIQKELDKNVN